MKPALLILAAGMGSRYGGLKQIEGVGPDGATLVEYSVYDALQAGFGRVVFVIREAIREDFVTYVARRFPASVEIAYAFQELHRLPGGFTPPAARTKPWGTGHAVLCARDEIREPFAVINADDYYGPMAFRRLADFLSQPPEPGPAAFAMVAYELGRTLSDHGAVSRGICEVAADGFLRSVTERTRIERDVEGTVRSVDAANQSHPLNMDAPASMNCFGFTPALFPALESQFREFLAAQAPASQAEFYLPEAVGRMIHRSEARVRVLHTPDDWHGLTYPEDRALTRQALARRVASGEYPERLWA